MSTGAPSPPRWPAPRLREIELPVGLKPARLFFLYTANVRVSQTRSADVGRSFVFHKDCTLFERRARYASTTIGPTAFCPYFPFRC